MTRLAGADGPVTRIRPPSSRALRAVASSALTPEQSRNVTPRRSKQMAGP
jgi:hypothetical protein